MFRVAVRSLELQLGDAFVLFRDLEVGGVGKRSQLNHVGAGSGQLLFIKVERVSHVAALDLGRLVAVIEVLVTESLKQTLRHELIDIRDLLVAVIHGVIILWVIF